MQRRGFLALVVALVLPTMSAAQSVVSARSRQAATDPDPCSGVTNCFTYTVATGTWAPQDLWGASGWIWTVRNPSATSPLRVEVGPGEFSKFVCANDGYVTLRGSGREQTILRGSPEAISATSCPNLSFLDLGAHGTSFGVNWLESGSSTWIDTDLVGGTAQGGMARGWNEHCFADPPIRSVHYLHSSRIRTLVPPTSSASGFATNCAENWIFGSQIEARSASALVTLFGLNVGGIGDARLFGTSISVSVEPNTASPTQIAGIFEATEEISGLSGLVRMFGGVVKVSAAGATTTANVWGLRRTGFGLIDTRETAFTLVPSPIGGTVRRLHVAAGRPRPQSPFLWESGPRPPVATTETNVLLSQDGSDVYVENDCDASGDCNSAGSEPHMMIYASALCTTSNPWFDTVTGRCRNDTTP